ncbi:MAG TPA: hypothetical protein VFY16_07840, partial [Gemmatimonadaceae bacterium]|nr:hypothetical protein [Gemmatimonadaceae bacterium]
MNSKRIVRALLASAVLLLPAAADAQVGHLPENSPFRDFPWRHELGTYGGWYAPSSDAAAVAPQAAPVMGVRYEVRIGGPVNFMARMGTAFSERTVLDRDLPPETRASTVSTQLFMADVGITMSLTGQKSWHGLMPLVQGGVGLVSDFESEDVSGYKLGTPFALTLGTGLRYTRGGRVSLRADLTDHFFQISYPDSYRQVSSGG